jgi:serine/threonine protein kinase
MNNARYENKTYIGSGGMASVYKAFDAVLEREVAIKEMAEQLRGNQEIRDLFLREAKKMASIKNQNVVQVYDVSDEGNVPTIIMEYMGGGNLAARMGVGSLAAEDVLKIVKQVTLGLQAIHAKGLVHRDVKPENILADDGVYKITDFGVAMSGEEDALPFVTNKYAAPEVLIEPDKIGPSSDIYSLGIMAIELLLGPKKFEEVVRETIERDQQLQLPAIKDSTQVFWQHWVASSAELPELYTLDSSISVEVSKFLAHVTRREQAERIQDCHTLLSELDEVIELGGQRATAPTAHDPKMKRRLDKLQAEREKGSEPKKKKKRSLGSKIAMGTGGLLLLAVLALLLIPTGPTRFYLDVVSEPPGALIMVNGSELSGDPTRTWFNGAWGDTVLLQREGSEPLEFVLSEDMEGLTETEQGFRLEVSLETGLSIRTSAEAAALLGERLPRSWPMSVSIDGFGTPSDDGDATTIPLHTLLNFQVQSERDGSLALIHLGSDDAVTLIYPNPAGVAPQASSQDLASVGSEINLITQEPVGTEWFVFISAEEALIPPTIPETQQIGDWATLYLLGGDESPGQSLVLWLLDATTDSEGSTSIIEIDVVAGGQ